MAGPTHDNPALREHRRRFRFTAHQGDKLRKALATLEEADEALNLALEHTGSPRPVTRAMRDAIRLLVFGPRGEFR